jgi:hypothetical protein
MGLLDFGAVPEGGVKGPYADYDTALTALRVDATASDGDLYQLDNGEVFAALTGDIGWLVPARAYGRISGLVSNATGNAEFTKADDLTAVTGRGWAPATSGGTVTKSANAALIINSGTPQTKSAEIRFTPTDPVAKGLFIAKFTSLTGSVMANNNMQMFTGAIFMRLTLTRSAPGGLDLLSTYNVVEVDSRGGLTNSTVSTPIWLAIEVDDTSTTTLQRVLQLDSDPQIVVEKQHVTTSPSSYVRLYTSNSTGPVHEIQCEEAAVFRYSA